MFEQFETAVLDTGEAQIFVRHAGSGPGLLLLHGFPQTHVMWRDLAPVLAQHFSVVCADLRGYGQSSCPASTPDHAPYAKRALAGDGVAVMQQLGHATFAVAGHDRGGRVAYRMALDHPDRIERLAVLDVVPTATVWEQADAHFALGFWPWALLAQPEPFPERLLAADPAAFIDNALSAWGSAEDVFGADVRRAYLDALRDPAHLHAICEEYRAAATLDWAHDQADQRAGRRIRAPLLALWSAPGAVGTWYAEQGGPLAIWRQWADQVQGRAFQAGHFFPEEQPEEVAGALLGFLTA